MFSSSFEPPLDPRQTEYFQHQQHHHQPSLQEEFYCPSSGFQPPPPPPPPPLIHYPGNHHQPPPPPPLLLPHEQGQMVGYSCQQQQHPSYDFSYCETQWTAAYYDGGQQCNQYEAYCVREAYRFSAIQVGACTSYFSRFHKSANFLVCAASDATLGLYWL